MGLQNSQVFSVFISLLEKYGQDEAVLKAIPLGGKIQVPPQDGAFLALIRIFFGRMLRSWGIIKDPTNLIKSFQEYFPTAIPSEVTQTLSRFRFGRSIRKSQEKSLIYPEIFCELYENYLNVKRHSTGSFYTPDFITEFMSHKCLNQIFRDGSREKPLDGNFTICDPACGTGRFLVAVASYLEELLLPGWRPRSGIDSELRLDLRRFILEHCIYGVEKDPIAAEICRLRLFAWFLDICPEEGFDQAMSLPQINHVRVGNSLIGLSAISNDEKNEIRRDPQVFLNRKLVEKFTNQGINVTETQLNEIKPFHWPLEFGCRFTLLIGNPPYGNILSKVEKDILRKKDSTVDEVYINFLLRILRDEIPFQYASFLTPKSYLIRQNFLDFRNMLLTKACPYAIDEIGSKKFKGALNEVQVLSFHRDPNYSSQLVVGSIGNPPLMVYNLQTQIMHEPRIDSLNVCKNTQCTGLHGTSQFELYTKGSYCPACGKPVAPLNRIRLKLDQLKYPIIEQIEKAGDLNYLNPWNFPDLKRGEEDQGLKRVRFAIRAYDPKLCAFITAKNDFSPYFLHPKKSFDLGQVQTQKDPRFYAAGPKLLIKHNSIVPEAVVTRDANCFTAAIYSLLHQDENILKYLCGLLNSTLMQFYCIFGINNQNLVTMNLNQYMIRHLPIISPQNARATFETIVSLVNQILENVKKSLGIFDTKNAPEIKQLNQAIYALYGISGSDTIKLIEQSVDESIHFFSKTRRKT